MKPLLTELATQGKPLVEIHITAKSNADAESLIFSVNLAADDIECLPGLYGPNKIFIQGTAESLGWLFGCRFYRHLITCEGSPECYLWRIEGNIKVPLSLTERILTIDGLSQPGFDDEGNNDTISYKEPSRLPL